MRLTWPEITPPHQLKQSPDCIPLLYSLDVFLPFVNQAASGSCNVAGQEFRVEGWLLRYYVWLQNIAG